MLTKCWLFFAQQSVRALWLASSLVLKHGADICAACLLGLVHSSIWVQWRNRQGLILDHSGSYNPQRLLAWLLQDKTSA